MDEIRQRHPAQTRGVVSYLLLTICLAYLGRHSLSSQGSNLYVFDDACGHHDSGYGQRLCLSRDHDLLVNFLQAYMSAS